MVSKKNTLKAGLGPFGSTKGEMRKAKTFLAKHGITTTSTDPKYVRRVANGVARQLAQGLPANRQASRGHITTAEHIGRKPPTMKRVISPAYKGRNPARARSAQMQEYLKARARTRNELISLPSGDALYISGRPKFILNGLKDAVAQGRRVDIQVYLANGKSFTLFNNARYRTRQHAIDAQVLLDRLEGSQIDTPEAALAEEMADALRAYGTDADDVADLSYLRVLQLELTTYA